jgi:MinD superfamily P-loop ATPase
MILSVASGKGGTGKTTIAVSLALALNQSYQVQFIDCDVEEPNAHLFLKPAISESRQVFIPVPEVIESRCTYCGLCAEVCAYKAIAVVKGTVLIFSELCHGCGGCSLLCPERALKEVGKRIGVMEIGTAGQLSFIDGRLDVGQALSPPLIRELKKNIEPGKMVIIDSPPGTSCPMVESVKNSDFCLLVTEPTPFGLNDLILSVETLKLMKIPTGVIINRAGIGDGRVEEYCRREGLPVLMSLPFDRDIATAYSEGIPIWEAKPDYRSRFIELFQRVQEMVR